VHFEGLWRLYGIEKTVASAILRKDRGNPTALGFHRDGGRVEGNFPYFSTRQKCEHSDMSFRNTVTSAEQVEIDRFVTALIQAFRDCGYPRSPLYLDIDDCLELEIRMPPSIPQEAIQELGENAARAFPAIEIIDLAPTLRGKGIFTKLVQGVFESTGVRAVVVSNVFNPEFAKALEAKCQIPSSGWRTHFGYGAPCFAYWGVQSDGGSSPAVQ
jgi:hypothetical protein